MSSSNTNKKKQTARQPSVVAPSTKSTGAATSGANADVSPTSAGTTGTKRSQMEQDFDRLRLLDKLEDGVDAIGPRGLSALCVELGIREGDVDLLIVAWRIGATQSMCITRSEWLFAMYQYKVEHMGQLKTLVPQWRKLVDDDDVAFADMYDHAYDFIRGDDEKLLPLDKAVKAWSTLLPENRFTFLTQWAQWLTVEYKRPISRDVWKQLLEFSRKIKDLETYDPNDKWPSALDDFVEWMLEKQKAAASAKSTAAGKNPTSAR